MKENKIIVCVSASFCEKKELGRILKKYSQYSDDNFAYWNEFAFTSEILEECEALLIFNAPYADIKTRCFPGNIIAFMMEPGVKSIHPWMFHGLGQYHLYIRRLINHQIQFHHMVSWDGIFRMSIIT
ncbi:MAG: hypothetical protein WDN26_04045 [Chitinophagaceae bacterium]